MRNLILAAVGILAMTAVGSTAPLDGLVGSKRVLLVFSPSDDPALAEQTALLKGVDEDLRDRDLVVLHVPPDGTTRTLFGDGTDPLPVRALRESRGIEPSAGFTALLIGKDGGTKWRENRPARPDELFALIDSMPMRAREMKRNEPSG